MFTWNSLVSQSKGSVDVVVGVCVGAVHHVFYEIFDMIGPQRDWWYWNPDVDTNQLLIGSVPVSSMVNFAFVMPAAFAFLVVVILERRPRITAGSIVGPARSLALGYHIEPLWG